LFTLATLATASLAQEADLIVHHGKVVTVDRDFTVRQAMAIKNGLILRDGCFWPSDFAFAARLTTGLILGSTSSIAEGHREVHQASGPRFVF
jgi:hypothetical protein